MATLGNQKITACLWFDRNAEEAVGFYTVIFGNSHKGKVSYYGEGATLPKGEVMTIQFQIEGQQFLALNGGPNFKLTEAVSFVVNCENQIEVDYFWERLSEWGEQQQCGWIKDKFGLSWQIVPTALSEMITSQEPERTKRVMDAVMKMKKLDIKALEDAFHGTSG